MTNKTKIIAKICNNNNAMVREKWFKIRWESRYSRNTNEQKISNR